MTAPNVIIEVSNWPTIGPYYVFPPEYVDHRLEDGSADYQAGRFPVWSIARAERDLTFHWKGAVCLIPAGTVIASIHADLYQRDGLHCLWLR